MHLVAMTGKRSPKLAEYRVPIQQKQS